MEPTLTLPKAAAAEGQLPGAQVREARLAQARSRVRTRKMLLAFHLSSIGLQIGVVAALLGLQLIAGFNDAVKQRVVLYDAITSLEYFALYPLVALSIISGVGLGIHNNSGFLTAWWLIAKQAAFGGVGILVAVFVGPGSVIIAERAAESTSLNPEIENLHFSITAVLVVYLVGSVGLVIISIFKPWGKRK